MRSKYQHTYLGMLKELSRNLSYTALYSYTYENFTAYCKCCCIPDIGIAILDIVVINDMAFC